MQTVIAIPARLQATRLPNKPLADIAGRPMIAHVWQAAVQSGLGPVFVAAADREIAEAVTKEGGEAFLTPADLPSGSDRVQHALSQWEEHTGKRADIIINLQGDLPTLSAHAIGMVHQTLLDGHGDADIATLAAYITTREEADNPNVVKAIISFDDAQPGAGAIGRALYFTRATAPGGDGPLFHHIGIYAYRRAALARFVSLSPSRLEQQEKLEQLRALEAGMRINVGLVDTIPLGVDTPADLEKARALLQATEKKTT